MDGNKAVGGTVSESEISGQRSIDGAHEAENGLCTSKLAVLPAATILDARALADCLAVSPRTLRRMVGRGQMAPGVKLGGRRVWMAGKVIEFLTDEADRLMASTKRLMLRRLDVGA
jgi:hypothetical protein